jgi:hypothetical protein
VLLPLLLLVACDGGDGPAPTPTPTVLQLPADFPEDFPTYEDATITAARRIGAAQGDIFVVGMETTDAGDVVRSFYEDGLAEDPWEVTNVVEIDAESTVVLEFARRGGRGQAGTLAIKEEQTDGRKTLITVSLPAPATNATPTPAASPGP